MAVQGLSHYLEHMLFMGSEKYPDENEYDAFISNNGGMANAYTELVGPKSACICADYCTCVHCQAPLQQPTMAVFCTSIHSCSQWHPRSQENSRLRSAHDVISDQALLDNINDT